MSTPRADVFPPNDLCDDALSVVLMHTSQPEEPQTLGQFARLSTRINDMVRNHIYWKIKTSIHFRKEYDKHLNDKKIDWYAIFKAQYQKHYRPLSAQQQKILCAIKENNLRAFCGLNPSYDDMVAICDNRTIILYAKSKTILRHAFEKLILPHYRANNFRFDNKRRTILYWAIICHVDRREIGSLLDFNHWATINETYFNKNLTPLHTAASSGRSNILDLLLSRGARLDTLDGKNETQTHSAAYYGKTNVIRYLIKKGCDLNQIGEATPLAYAAKNNHIQAVKLLLKHGANPQYSNSDQNNALHYACAGSLACTQIILEHDPSLLDSTNVNNISGLLTAVSSKNHDIAAYLIEKGAKFDIAINFPSNKDHNKTAALIAIDNYQWRTLNLLIHAGSDFSSIVDYIFAHDNADALAMLLKLQPARFTDHYKGSLLLRAAVEGKDLLSFFLGEKTKATVTNEDGMQPIHLAAINGNEACIFSLEANNVALDTPFIHAGHPDNGKTPLFFAHEAGKTETANWLMKHMTDKQLFNALVLAIRLNNHTLVEAILKHKKELTQLTDTQQRTALMIAEQEKNEEAIKLCYEHNKFESAEPRIFKDIDSFNMMNNCIEGLNNQLKSTPPDVELMIDTQKLLRKLNSSNVTLEDKGAEIDAYYAKTHHSGTDVKYALCVTASIVLALIIIATLAATFTLGALTPVILLCSIELAATLGLCGLQFPTFINRNSFFSTYQKERATDELTNTAKKLIFQ